MGNVCQGTTTKKNEVDDDERVRMSLDLLFPNFEPVTKDSEKWQKVEDTHCPECASEFDFMTFREHCRSCGRIFCTRCVYQRKAIRKQYICGLCMGHAMSTLRHRELSKIENRMRTHSQLIRERQRRNSEISQQHEGEGQQHAAGDEEMKAVATTDEGSQTATVEVSPEPAQQREQEQTTAVVAQHEA